MGPRPHQQAKQQAVPCPSAQAKAPGGSPVPRDTIGAKAPPAQEPKAKAPGGSPVPGNTIVVRAQPAWQRPLGKAFLAGRSRVREIRLVSYGHREDRLSDPRSWRIFNVEHLSDPSSSDSFNICFKILFIFGFYIFILLYL